MKRNLVCFDTETTGLDKKNDQVIQLSCIKMDKETLNEIDERNWYILPAHKFTIAPDAEKVHGITKEFLEENGVDIRNIAPDFMAFIHDCDILGYNSNNFDLEILNKDLGLFGYDIFSEDRNYFDAYAMEARLFPRNLQAVYKKYTGEEFEDAHNSLADVKATCEVFRKQLQTQSLTLDEVREWDENNILSPEGSIRNATVGEGPRKIVFKIGKYKDSDVAEIIKSDRNYMSWFYKNVASNKTKQIINEYYYEKYPKKS